MDDLTLAALEHENMTAAMTSLGSSVDGSLVRREDGIAIVATGLPLLLFNQVIVDGVATADGLVAAVEVMRRRDGPFVVNLRLGLDDGFVGLMEDLGLVRLSERPWMPGMALYPIPGTGEAAGSGEHVIRPVTGHAGLEDHIRTAAGGFGMPEKILRAVMTSDLVARDEVVVYVGYARDEPVTTGVGFRTGRTIGVYNIATLEHARGRGHGAAMTRRIAADGFALGCDVAILQASDIGYPVYERLGYRTVVEYMGYVEPAD
jgi:GNAT superfamily N-acetyltransferase